LSSRLVLLEQVYMYPSESPTDNFCYSQLLELMKSSFSFPPFSLASEAHDSLASCLEKSARKMKSRLGINTMILVTTVP
jgi:hypothetical protein